MSGGGPGEGGGAAEALDMGLGFHYAANVSTCRELESGSLECLTPPGANWSLRTVVLRTRLRSGRAIAEPGPPSRSRMIWADERPVRGHGGPQIVNG